MSRALVWFRQDLRLNDNPALHAACQAHDEIIFLYILDEHTDPVMGAAQRWWLHHSLKALADSLEKKGQSLTLCRGHALDILKKLTESQGISSVFWNRCYEPSVIARDKEIKASLKSQNIDVFSFNGSLLLEPWQVSPKQAQYYKVFTPFWRQALSQINIQILASPSHWPKPFKIESEVLDDWALCPTQPNWAASFHEHWQIGETAAMKRLHDFCEQALAVYSLKRDEPATAATSRLSPHLHFGEISPQQIWQHTSALLISSPHIGAIEHFQRELGWREFSYHLLYHYPELTQQNFKREFDAFPWSNDPIALKRWQQGKTGYPIVDAGMRELWHTGFMHNRVRMIAASFLIKDLLIDWRLGAAWFWDTLVDADLASNSASWQWVAGSGADAAPYFRIFNPILQGEKFDPQGHYIKRWLPELATVPARFIHRPWEAQIKHLNYPAPMVAHDKARLFALECYAALKGQSA